MDKENIKMLREHIETYKKLRDESNVTPITFTTPGHCYGVEKNPEFIKPLLDTIIQVFETKLDIAIYGDVPIPLSESCEYKIAKKLEHAVNNYSFNPDRFAEAIPYMHRTLQQSIFRLIKSCICYMAKVDSGRIDDRNRASYEMCKVLIDTVNKYSLPHI